MRAQFRRFDRHRPPEPSGMEIALGGLPLIGRWTGTVTGFLQDSSFPGDTPCPIRNP
jgi:hypothetical protein